MEIAVVLVTFNRLKNLKVTLDKYVNQNKLPKYIVVVDNASTDGTREYLNEWKKKNIQGIEKKVITANRNLGGSGGFALGIEEGCKLDCDYIFLADDDAVPEENMLSELERQSKRIPDKKIAALCTAIYNYDKHEYMHRCNIKKNIFGIKFKGLPESEYSKPFFKVDVLTFVGACISKEVAKKIDNVSMNILSMGMSGDYAEAIRAGSNHIRVGSKIFGPRIY